MYGILRFLSLLAIAIGVVTLITATRSNRTLSDEVLKLEAELGRMSIDDVDKVYVVAIEDPAIPPEVAVNIDKVWQFRCYLPAGYDVSRFNAGGRVTDRGIFFQGGYSSGSSSGRTEPSQQLLTISLRQKEKNIECFTSFGGSSSTTTWNRLSAENSDWSDWVIKPLVAPGKPAQSFDQSTILTLLKIYDPNTGEEKQVDGESITTYQGGMFLLFPRSLQTELTMLRKGELPEDFNISHIAEGERQ
ncbi:hypothetical protein FF011L_53070 [Roseimaritima multifibrata]|uniref:Uncharacterized protein n=1 Tax=Roseimaritima multifibrata TaxID=1930274 RepID=A0A517MNN4_9BACT|nr:hypothetical protein [Roseimaritima multifibrata]QDS96495.1 hypothetical protein FF011L_53070 [Roseimaritima multifibrata]